MAGELDAEALQTRVNKLEETLEWFATSGHNAYHKSQSADWRECNKPLCAHTKRVLDGG